MWVFHSPLSLLAALWSRQCWTHSLSEFLHDGPLVNPPRTQKLLANAKSGLVKKDMGQLVSSLPSFYRGPCDSSKAQELKPMEIVFKKGPFNYSSEQQETRKKKSVCKWECHTTVWRGKENMVLLDQVNALGRGKEPVSTLIFSKSMPERKGWLETRIISIRVVELGIWEDRQHLVLIYRSLL